MMSIESRVTSLVLRSKISPFVFLKTLSSPGAPEHEDGLASELYYPSGWAATRARRLRARTVLALRTLRPLVGLTACAICERLRESFEATADERSRR